MKTTQTKLPKSQIEIEFELTEEEFKRYIERILEHLKKHVKIDGFRPGHAPTQIVEEKIKKESLLMEAGDAAVREVYLKYMQENNLESIGQPEVSIIKIAQGSPFVFKAKITVLPEIELPNYKEIAQKVIRQPAGKEIFVTEQDVQDALNYLQKARAKFTAENRPAEKKDFVEIIYQNKDINGGKEIEDRFILGEGGFIQGFEDNIVGMKTGQEKEFVVKFPSSPTKNLVGDKDSPKKELAGKETDFKVKLKSVQKMELPEISDEFAKELGSDTLAVLKTNIKEGMTTEKQEAEKQRKRGEILDKICETAEEKNSFEIPEILINYEKDRLLENLKQQVTHNIKISFEEYLATIKQTKEGLKENFSKEAEKKLKNFLVLREIGKKEKIEVSEKEIEEEMDKTLKYQKIEKFDTEQFKEYTKGAIFNEKVFQRLENFGANS